MEEQEFPSLGNSGSEGVPESETVSDSEDGASGELEDSLAGEAEGDEQEETSEEEERNELLQAAEEDDERPTQAEATLLDKNPGLKHRLERLVAQRREARSAEQEAKGQLSELTKERDKYEQALKGWEHVFGEYDNPLAAALFQRQFMGEMQRMAQSDPDVQHLVERAVQGVRATQSREGMFPGQEAAAPRQPAAPAPRRREAPSREKESGVSEELRELRQDRATELVGQVLSENKVDPKWHKAISRAAMDHIDLDKRADRTAVVKAIQSAAKDLDVDLTELVGSKKQRGKRPPVGRGGGAPFAELRRRAEGGEGERGGGKKGPKAPETPSEGEAYRANFFERLAKAADKGGRLRAST